MKKITTSVRDEDFHRFWTMYPRKVCKIAAQKAYAQARKLVSAADIIDGLLHYPFSADSQFQPHAASWLNAGGWIMEADTPPPTVIVDKSESAARAFERMLDLDEGRLL